MENKIRYRSLSRRADFEGLRLTGRSFHVNSWLLVNARRTQLGELRCGWTIPRQVGPAVVRNRLRRWGREFFRRWSAGETRGLDLNLVFKRRDKDFYKALNHGEFDEALAKTALKLGALS